MGKIKQYGLKDYASAIFNNEGCHFIGNDQDGIKCFENDEISVKYKHAIRKDGVESDFRGEMNIIFKDESNLPSNEKNTIDISVDYSEFSIYLGEHCGIFVMRHVCDETDQWITIYTMSENKEMMISLTKDFLINTRTVLEDEVIDTKEDISDLSINYLIERIYLSLVDQNCDFKTLERYIRIFEIIRPLLVLKLSELVNQWTQLVTAEALKLKKYAQVNEEKISELLEQLDVLLNERAEKCDALIGYTNIIDNLYSTTEEESGIVYKK